MKIIEKLSKMIKEEVHDAEKYINCAIKYKEEKPALSRVFYQLSEDELEHQKRLHDQVVLMIKEYNDAGNTVPEGMQAIYDFIHDQIIEEVAEIKMLQSMYKEA